MVRLYRLFDQLRGHIWPQAEQAPHMATYCLVARLVPRSIILKLMGQIVPIPHTITACHGAFIS